MKKHFNLWVVLSLPILILITNQIHVVLSLMVFGGSFVWLATEYDDVSFRHDEKKYFHKR